MKKGTIKRLMNYILQYKMMLVMGILGAIISVVCTLLVPVIIGKAIDNIIGIGEVNFTAIKYQLYQLAAVAAGAAIFQWIMLMCIRNVSALSAQVMRSEAFDRICKAPIRIIDSHPHGDLVTRLVTDSDNIAEGLLQALTQLLPGIVTIVVTIILMLILNAGIALIVILVTPLSIFFARFIGSKTARYFRDQSRAQGEMGGFVNEMVTNKNIVNAMCYEEDSAEKFSDINYKYYVGNYKATFYSSVSNPGTRFVNSLVYAAVGILGALLAIRGGITIGSISAFLSYANQYTKPFNDVTSVLTQIQAAFASAERIFEVIDWESEPEDGKDKESIEKCEGRVLAEDVFFAYDKERPLIESFNMDARPGMHFALVGPTGCGKTTIINLLMRFYDVDSGQIAVDDIPIQNMGRSELRGLYGMVLQDSWLKQASVYENIAYGRPDASKDEIVEAAKAAYAHGFIMRMPNGYDTILESGGGNLSEGQKQLLCIARIMLSKPYMLILDEATSSIDTRTEMLIQMALDKLMKGRTSFIVAHRLSTIQNADCILVMKDGRIIEQGKHEKLLAVGGFYANLYNSQFSIE